MLVKGVIDIKVCDSVLRRRGNANRGKWDKKEVKIYATLYSKCLYFTARKFYSSWFLLLLRTWALTSLCVSLMNLMSVGLMDHKCLFWGVEKHPHRTSSLTYRNFRFWRIPLENSTSENSSRKFVPTCKIEQQKGN